MIKSYAYNGCGEEALALFQQMKRICINYNNSTLISVLSACVLIQVLKHGKKVHARIIKNEFEPYTHLWSNCVLLYGNCRDLAHVRHLFAKIPIQDVISWTMMTARCVQ